MCEPRPEEKGLRAHVGRSSIADKSGDAGVGHPGCGEDLILRQRGWTAREHFHSVRDGQEGLERGHLLGEHTVGVEVGDDTQGSGGLPKKRGGWAVGSVPV